MQSTVKSLLVVPGLAVLLTACTSGPSKPLAPPGSTASPANSLSTTDLQDGQYTGQGKYPVSFTLSNGTVTDLKGSTTLYCVSGNADLSQIHDWSDPNSLDVDQSGHFSDDYQYSVGNGTATLHVQGEIAGDGTATGFSSIDGVACSAGREGWAAALPGSQLPEAPTPPTTAPAGCTPQPCAFQSGITLSVQGATRVTGRDDSSLSGVDVAFTVVNNWTQKVTITNSQGHFTLHFADGNVAEDSWAPFVDSSGADVPCIHGDAIDVMPGQQVSEHVCFALTTGDEAGQAVTLRWLLVDPGNFNVPLSPLP